jgi:hypothetical protein
MAIKLSGMGALANASMNRTRVDVSDTPSVNETTTKNVQTAAADNASATTTTKEFFARTDSGQEAAPVVSADSPVQTTVRRVAVSINNVPPDLIVTDTGVKPKKFSAVSAKAPFETLFNAFDIEAFPFYNFWVADELANDKDELGNRKLDEVPRYVKIAWNSAPATRDDDSSAADVSKRRIKSILFSREIERKNSFFSRGISFTPSHLQPSGFSKVKGILSNGHLAPGVLETVIDMPVNNGVGTFKSFSQLDGTEFLDEDAFLNNRSLDGISIHELKSQAQQITSGLLNVFSNGNTIVAKSMDSLKMKTDVVDPSSSNVSYCANAAWGSKDTTQDLVRDKISLVTQPTSINVVKDLLHIKTKFVDPSIGGAIGKKKVQSVNSPHQAETMACLSYQLPNLEVLSRTSLRENVKIDVLTVPSPKMKRLEYIGYVIEKYVKNDSGVFVKIDEIDIPSPEANFYIDTKILYGKTYRYRMRSIIRWTRNSVQNQENKTANSQTKKMSSYESAFVGGEWSMNWTYASVIDIQPPFPPDEITVRPESHKKRIVVTFRLPENLQRDIMKMVLLRKIRDSNGNDVSEWTKVTESNSSGIDLEFAPGNVLFIDKDVDFVQTSGKKYVYAAQCVSLHGEYSTLSEQFCTSLNEDYFSTGENPVEFVSSSGVRPEYFGAFSTIPNRTTKTDVILSAPLSRNGKSAGTAALVVSGRNVVGNTVMNDSDYIVRATSLDTGEKCDTPFNVSFVAMPIKQFISPANFMIQTHTSVGKNSNEYETINDSLNTTLKTLLDASMLDTGNEEEEVLPRDRALPGERW